MRTPFAVKIEEVSEELSVYTNTHTQTRNTHLHTDRHTGLMDITRVVSIHARLRPIPDTASKRLAAAKNVSVNAVRLLSSENASLVQEIYPSGAIGANGKPMFVKVVVTASRNKDCLQHDFRVSTTFCGSYHGRVEKILDKAAAVVRKWIGRSLADACLLTTSVFKAHISDSDSLKLYLTGVIKAPANVLTVEDGVNLEEIYRDVAMQKMKFEPNPFSASFIPSVTRIPTAPCTPRTP